MGPGRLAELRARVAPGSLLVSEAELAVYSYDGALDRARPDAVLVARSAEEVRRAVQWCAAQKVPFVARGEKVRNPDSVASMR